jgi:hypothetical protein
MSDRYFGAEHSYTPFSGVLYVRSAVYFTTLSVTDYKERSDQEDQEKNVHA